MKFLSDILPDLPGARLVGDPAAPITGIEQDSRRISAGNLFVGIPGGVYDGADFAAVAVERGAAAVIAEREIPGLDAPQIIVPDARLALGLAAASFYDHPSRKLKVVGVTGTDGKTTTTHLLRHIYEANGERAGLVSTVHIIGISNRRNRTSLTTPDAVVIQSLLAEMLEAGCARAVLETSSHALDQRRVDAVRLVGGVCTNIDEEHLNYHKTLDNYVAAKGRLFELVARERGVIVRNAENPNSRRLPRPSGVTELTFGIAPGSADVYAEAIEPEAEHTSFDIVTPVGRVRVRTNFVGSFNVANWLAAAALAVGEGIPLAVLPEAARLAHPVTGRLDRIREGQPFAVIVDFAHTPQALEAAINAVRPETTGKLFVVFGHPGERDARNRPRMGKIAAEMADCVIVTMDDPYGEDPNVIADAIQEGIAQSDRQPLVLREIDRREAIRIAFTLANPGDTVLIAGRGHEPTIIVGDRTLPFTDSAVCRELLHDLGYRRHPRP